MAFASIEVCLLDGAPPTAIGGETNDRDRVDVNKQSVTAVAVDEAGRMLDERTVVVGSDELVGWASALDAERLCALEDCRLLTAPVGAAAGWPGRGAGQGLAEADGAGASGGPDAREVGPDRRARGRRVALREPGPPRPQPGEGCIARSSCW